jgi:hypothetical protein
VRQACCAVQAADRVRYCYRPSALVCLSSLRLRPISRFARQDRDDVCMGKITAFEKQRLSRYFCKRIPADARLGFHPDDTTPIPRPSCYYGRRQDLVTRDRAQGRCDLEAQPPADTSIVPLSSGVVPGQIDKSVLTIAEPKRLRDKAHLRFVASQPCLVCGRQPCDPHHLRFAQPRALGMKVSDEFTVPLCRGHHRQLHQGGNEVTWWETRKIKALDIAKELWERTRPKSAVANRTMSVRPDE